MKIKQNKNELIDADNRLVVTRGEGDGEGEMGKGVKCTMTHENQTFDGEHTIEYSDYGVYKLRYTPET